MLPTRAYPLKPISKVPHSTGLARIDWIWQFFFGVMGLSSQFFIFQCPTQSFTRSASWRINLFHFLAFLFQAMYGLLVFYMIFQAVMILKGSYNVISMKWELRNCIAFDCFSDSSSWESSCMDLGSCCGIWVSSKYLNPLPNWTLRERVLPSRGESTKPPAPASGSLDPTSWMVALVCG